MPKGYWIATMDVKDAAVYDTYRAANAKPLADYNARFLVRGGTQENTEGNWRSRTVVIEFDSYADALACYNSDAYKSAKDIRVPVSENNMVIVEGYDG